MIKLALIQVKVTKNKSQNLLNALRKTLEASEAGANIAVLPECFNSPYGTSYFEEYAEVFNEKSDTLRTLSDIAKKTKMILVGGSVPERDEASGKLYNTCTVWGEDGTMIAKHRKVLSHSHQLIQDALI